MIRLVKDTKYMTYQQASLSQKVSYKIPILRDLAGSDPIISDKIAVLSYLKEKNMIPHDAADFALGLLNVLRLSHFATSERTNEVSKLGLMLPKQDDEEDWSE